MPPVTASTDRRSVDVELVKGQPVVPSQMRAHPWRVVTDGRVATLGHCLRPRALPPIRTLVRGHQSVTTEQSVDLAMLAAKVRLSHDRGPPQTMNAGPHDKTGDLLLH